MLESLLEAIDRILSEGKISWGAIITSLLFFNKIQRNKEFRIRDKRVEKRQKRIESKVDALLAHSNIENIWGGEEEWVADKKNLSERIATRLLIGLRTIIYRVHIMALFIHQPETEPLKSRRKKKMQKLKSRKFWLTILAVLIPVINNEFGLNLSFDDIAMMISAIMTGVACLAHVDGKKASAALAAVKVAVTADPNTTYKDMIKTVNVVHNAITSILADLKKDDGSAAFKAAADAYTQLHNIVDDFRKPDPLPEIPTLAETKVS